MFSQSRFDCRSPHKLWQYRNGLVGGYLLVVVAVALTGCSEKRVPVFRFQER